MTATFPVTNYLARTFWLLLFLLVSSFAFSQQDIELADYYYQNGQFAEAKLYYERVYKTNKTNKVYTNYLNTLIALNEFEEAEKMVKKKIKSENEDGVAYVQLGELYNKFNKKSEAQQEFDRAIDKVVPTRTNIMRLASEFSRINEYTYALQAYEKGKKNDKEGYSFSYEIATIKGNLGQYPEMIESYLDLINESPNYIQTVQNSLDRTLQVQENEANMELLKTALLRRTQKSPENVQYIEMLTWLFLQKKEFGLALIQTQALDKRFGENGYRVMDLAELAASNKDYVTATKAYQYIIDKGPATEYYYMARTEKLQVMSLEIASRPGIDREAYATLASDYEATLQILGKSAESAIMMKDLAHIYAFFLGKTELATTLLQEAIALPGLYGKTQAICKLELADVYVFQNEVWDASLLYSQVELDFKDDPLGAEAKFRNARVSYYTGDFEWAQGQLDALKASTTKLISNDAIDLSLLITDNFNLDTILAPMQMFARADLLSFQNKFNEANVVLDSILTDYPTHSLTDEILMLKADMRAKSSDYKGAVELYKKIVELHFKDITADDAIWKLAEISEKIEGDTAGAMSYYEKIITEYPGSLYVVEARKRFRELRGN